MNIEYVFQMGGIDSCHSPHSENNRCLPFTVIVYVEEGAYYCRIDGRNLSVGKGQALVVPPFITNNIRMDAPGRLTWAHVSAVNAAEDIIHSYIVKNVLDGEDAGQVRSCIASVVQAARTADPMLRRVAADASIASLYSLLLSRSVPKTSQCKYAPVLKSIVHEIAENPQKTYTLAELAKRASMSPSSFSLYFKQVYEISPMKYVLDQKLKSAAILLLQGIPVKTVALSLGFCDAYHFSKQFKKVFFYAPRQYAAIRKNTL